MNSHKSFQPHGFISSNYIEFRLNDKWSFSKIFKSSGSIENYKATFVLKGFKKKETVVSLETYSVVLHSLILGQITHTPIVLRVSCT